MNQTTNNLIKFVEFPKKPKTMTIKVKPEEIGEKEGVKHDNTNNPYFRSSDPYTNKFFYRCAWCHQLYDMKHLAIECFKTHEYAKVKHSDRDLTNGREKYAIGNIIYIPYRPKTDRKFQIYRRKIGKAVYPWGTEYVFFLEGKILIEGDHNINKRIGPHD